MTARRERVDRAALHCDGCRKVYLLLLRTFSAACVDRSSNYVSGSVANKSRPAVSWRFCPMDAGDCEAGAHGCVAAGLQYDWFVGYFSLRSVFQAAARFAELVL